MRVSLFLKTVLAVTASLVLLPMGLAFRIKKSETPLDEPSSADAVLKKIKYSGFRSLTPAEREILFSNGGNAK